MWLPEFDLGTTHRSAKQMCSVFFYNCLLPHCMYIIHSKAKLSVIDIEKAIKNNVIISNIASPPIS